MKNVLTFGNTKSIMRVCYVGGVQWQELVDLELISQLTM